ncbi:MAG: hypothetical protein ACO1SV_14060 [Fimbriimonas sp.]
MGFSALPLGLALLTASGQGAAKDPRFRLSYGSGSAENQPADAKLLTRNAEYLLARNDAALIREANSPDPLRSQAARLIMLGAGESRFFPILLDRVGGTRPLDNAIAHKTIVLYPAASWPILQRRARQGVPGAFTAIGNYATLGEPELRALARDPSPKVRAEAVRNVRDLATLRRAVNDSAPGVQRAAVGRLMREGEFHSRALLRDGRPRVRALAAEFSPTWTRRDFSLWVSLAADPSPEVRKWAVLQLAPLGLNWGHGRWTSSGIEAVGRAIERDRADVRRHAVLAARSWLLEWPKIGTLWTPAQIGRARAIFRHPNFRNAVYAQALAETRNQGVSDPFGVHVAPAYEALALSGDPRTLDVFRRGIGQAPWERREWIAALIHVPGPRVEAYLFDLVDFAARRPDPGPQEPSDFYADAVFGSVSDVLLLRGTRNYARVIAHLDDRRLPSAFRAGIARGFARVDSKPVFDAIRRLIVDASVPESTRVNVTYALVSSPRPEARTFLEGWAKSAPTEPLRQAARDALRMPRGR